MRDEVNKFNKGRSIPKKGNCEWGGESHACMTSLVSPPSLAFLSAAIVTHWRLRSLCDVIQSDDSFFKILLSVRGCINQFRQVICTSENYWYP